MLKITNLHVIVDDKEVLNGINLHIKPGETHAIMGPNGSGKSTLANILAGREGYIITQGEICYKDTNLLHLTVDERARAGIFLALQYPVEIPGVSSMVFLKTAVNSVRKHQGLQTYDAVEFLSILREKQAAFQIDDKLLTRPVNKGFSGGEKKRFEILQMALLEPQLAILDETDSGLDIDALKIVSEGVNGLRSPEKSMVIITHYKRLLDYIVPDVLHVMVNGKIVASGDKALANTLEANGYVEFQEEKSS